MAETSPTSSELTAFSATTDAATGVTYIEQYKGLDWYDKFIEFSWRIVKAFKAAGELRVYKDAALTVGIRAGQFMDGDIIVSYAGSTGNAITDDATNYVYLTRAGVLTINVTGFPVPSVTPHIPLAVVIAAATDIDLDNITDYRGRAIWSTLGIDRQIVCVADTVVCADNNVVYL